MRLRVTLCECVFRTVSSGWAGTSFQQRSFNFDDYDDSTPTLPLADCADRRTVMGVSTSFSLEYSGFTAQVPAGLAALVEAECAAKTRKSRANLGFTADYLVSEGSLGRKRNRRDGEEATDDAPAVPEDVAANATVAEEPAEKTNFVINVDFSISGRSGKNFGWSNQDLAKSLMKDTG